MSKYFLIFLFFTPFVSASAQIGHGGRPSVKLEGKTGFFVLSDKQKITLPAPPKAVVKESLAGSEKGRPLQFAYPNFVDLTPDNSGHTTVLEDGRLLWSLKLSSPGAYSLNIIFDKFHLNQEDSVFIYNPSGSFVIGALTQENNKEWGGLATAPVPGDEVIVEWRGMNSGRESTRLKIGVVNHDYLNIFQYLNSGVGNFGSSGSCHTDLSCYDDPVYLQDGQAVCQIIIDGNEFCSGTLMNNSNNDGIPYVLTAGHCLGQKLAPQSVVFIFNYEVPACQKNIQGSRVQSISGASLRAFADQLDFALLEMSEYPPEYFRAYYAGWNLQESQSSVVHTIHHPSGDVKKVAVSEGTPTNATFSTTSELGNPFETNSHWRIAKWAEGTTEGGSSGAGLFIKDGALIGSLSGGAATCDNPVNDYFVRLNKIWDYLPYDTARVDVWLNPAGDGRTYLNGFDPNNSSMFRLSHFPDGGTPQIIQVAGGDGYWSGTNSLLTANVAERYNEVRSGKVYGVFLMPGINKVYGDGKVDIQIWSGLDKPQTLMTQKQAIIQGSTNKEVLILFDDPVYVSGPFYVGYKIDYTAPADSFAVYQVNLPREEDSFYLNDPVAGWKLYDKTSGEVPSALWIDALVGEVIFTDSSKVKIPENQLIIAPNPVRNYMYIHYKDDGNGKATVFDMAGKPLFSENIVIYKSQYSLDLKSRLAPGVYLLQLEINGRKLVCKFAVQ
jgi:lysyl endopeptidase